MSLKCLKCDYDLRGSDGVERCPECGVRIAVVNITYRARREPTHLAFLLSNALVIAFAAALAGLFLILPADARRHLNESLVVALLVLAAVIFVIVFFVHRAIMRSVVRWWPQLFTVSPEGVRVARAADPGRGRLYHWSDLRHVRRMRGVTGAPCIRLGTGYVLGVLSIERAMELDCDASEAALIHAEVQRGIDHSRRPNS